MWKSDVTNIIGVWIQYGSMVRIWVVIRKWRDREGRGGSAGHKEGIEIKTGRKRD